MTALESLLNEISKTTDKEVRNTQVRQIVHVARREIETNDPYLLPRGPAKLTAISNLIDFLTSHISEYHYSTLPASVGKAVMELVQVLLANLGNHFYRRELHFKTFMLKLVILVEWVIIVDESAHYRSQVARYLVEIVDSCIRKDDHFKTTFEPSYIKRLKHLLPKGKSLTSRLDDVDGGKAPRFLPHEEISCAIGFAFCDVLVDDEETKTYSWLSEVLCQEGFSISPFIRRNENPKRRAQIQVVRVISPNCVWGLTEADDIQNRKKIIDILSSIDPDDFKNREPAYTRRFNHVYLCVVEDSKGRPKVARVQVCESGNLFDLEKGVIIKNAQLPVYEANDHLLKTQSKLVLLMLEGIAPTPVSVRTTTSLLRILFRMAKSSLVSVPSCTTKFALTVLKNKNSFDVATRRYAADFLLILAAAESKKRMTPWEDTRIKQEMEILKTPKAVQILHANLAPSEESADYKRLTLSCLSMFTLWTRDNNRQASFEISNAIIKNGFLGLLRKFSGIHQELAFVVVKNIILLSIVYGDHINIMKDDEESREDRSLRIERNCLAKVVDGDDFSDDEIVDSSLQYTTEIIPVLEKEVIGINETIYERQRMIEFGIEESDVVSFLIAPCFEDGINDGRITDSAAAFLNGTSRGHLWIGVSPKGMIEGVSADSKAKDNFKNRMFKLMRTMFPPVQNEHFDMTFYEVISGQGQVKCIVQLSFTPDGHLYSTPQKRCTAREKNEETGLWNIFVLDTAQIVRRAVEQDETEYRGEIHFLKRILQAIPQLPKQLPTESIE